MADRYVTGVRTDTINLPVAHEHPFLFKLDDETEMAIGEVIGAIEEGDRFIVVLDGGRPVGTVHVHECPNCSAYPYLCGGGPLDEHD